ncbi:cupin domain-containing protein [Catenulispora subtropica]|uniref:Cupin domain-containing protein n=1 Tax=Catenulispora subtropica TaxID=450798 RepID=A0ABN2SYD5_9ACTN
MSEDRTAVPGFAVHVADAVLEAVELEPSQIVAGEPRVSELVLSESEDGRVVRGIWQMTPGVVTDTEADEVFVVLSGRATVEFEDGTVLEVGPGDVAVLTEGARTRWTVHETLRKVYQATVDPVG